MGAAVPGFHVAEATPERHLLLTGRHLLYRVAVIGSGAHGLLVPRMLRAVRARAEGRAASHSPRRLRNGERGSAGA